jgi:hypothetical protein
MLSENFDALLTFDKNLQYQQNFIKSTITVFVMSAPINSYEVLTLLSPQIKEILASEKMSLGTVGITNTL